ncbi:vascular endothelial growth factor [Bovine papular stomatitis virus]|uniref:Vascular endothelial growth factor n=1 Tax=Bovine papular stomatitis virus TaxID=129727 RepID=A0A0E3XBH2_9POXV|nr:vascular endothelial growth factor [Bovine papular stomatitis virus]AKC03433.1 vascular endothelial growth factor [Bovine papular stomatitis virus]
MKCLIACVQWSLALLLCLQCVKWMQAAPTSSNGNHEVEKWSDVYDNSRCQPMKTPVKVSDEYPDNTNDRHSPPCVTLMRCGGCCNDESLECVPTETSNVTMQIMTTSAYNDGGTSGGISSGMREMSFLQHNKCECRPKSTPPPETTEESHRR